MASYRVCTHLNYNDLFEGYLTLPSDLTVETASNRLYELMCRRGLFIGEPAAFMWRSLTTGRTLSFSETFQQADVRDGDRLYVAVLNVGTNDTDVKVGQHE